MQPMTFRRRWWVIIPTLALAVAACGGTGSGNHAAGTAASTTSQPLTPSPITNAVELKVAMTSWQLPAPIANEVLITDGSHLTVLGGLDATKLSTKSIVRLNPTSGTTLATGALSEAVHDSAGVRIGNNILVLGGGGPSENGTADAQLVGPDGHASVVGKMPKPR
jgi:hypothetical protein